eukprot:Nk52_evm23s248 gene=Nk52_evmTU23s248
MNHDQSASTESDSGLDGRGIPWEDTRTETQALPGAVEVAAAFSSRASEGVLLHRGDTSSHYKRAVFVQDPLEGEDVDEERFSEEHCTAHQPNPNYHHEDTLTSGEIEAPFSPKQQKHVQEAHRRKYMLGLFLLGGVICLWIGSSELTQYIYRKSSASSSSEFNKPLFVTYWNTSLFSLYLIKVGFWGGDGAEMKTKSRQQFWDVVMAFFNVFRGGFVLTGRNAKQHEQLSNDGSDYESNVNLSNNNFHEDNYSSNNNNNSHLDDFEYGAEDEARLLPLGGEEEEEGRGLIDDEEVVEGGGGRRGEECLIRGGMGADEREQEEERFVNDYNKGINGRDERREGDSEVVGEMRKDESDAEGKIAPEEMVQTVFSFLILFFSANYVFNLALLKTNVSSATLISSTSGFFTLLLSVFLDPDPRHSQRLGMKFFLVLVSCFGVGLVTFSDSIQKESTSDHDERYSINNNTRSIYDSRGHDSLIRAAGGIEEGNDSSNSSNDHLQQSVFGDALALLSAFFYGFYLVLMKVRLGDEERVDMFLFFGLVGISCAIFALPLFPLFHLVGIEKFELPSDNLIWLFLAINGLIGTVLSDYLWMRATLLTTPLVTTIGLSLTIPGAVIGDVIVGTFKFSVYFLIGTILQGISFLLLNKMSYEEES